MNARMPRCHFIYLLRLTLLLFVRALSLLLLLMFLLSCLRLVEQVAQQMSGRAGRRGLDTQGNLLYMNLSMPEIQSLMLGEIPAIKGKDPQYPTIALHQILSGAVSLPYG